MCADACWALGKSGMSGTCLGCMQSAVRRVGMWELDCAAGWGGWEVVVRVRRVTTCTSQEAREGHA